MPTYDFKCPEGHDFEHFFRTMSSATLELACPVCGQLAKRQVSAGAGLVFKGSGFYITDYGKDGKKDQRQAASDSSKSEAPTAESSKAESGKGESTTSEASSSESSKSESSKSDSSRTTSAKSDATGSAGGGKSEGASKPEQKPSAGSKKGEAPRSSGGSSE
jgi:putative FmdB family regulatory protein